MSLRNVFSDDTLEICAQAAALLMTFWSRIECFVNKQLQVPVSIYNWEMSLFDVYM